MGKKNYNHYSHSSPTIDAAAWTQEAELSCSSLLCSWTNAQSPEGRSHHISCFDSLPNPHLCARGSREEARDVHVIDVEELVEAVHGG